MRVPWDDEFTLARTVWICVPPWELEAGFNPPILEERSKPASLVLSTSTGPLMVGALAGPVISRFAVSVPPCKLEPLGRRTPAAGNNASTWLMGRFGAARWSVSVTVGPVIA